MAMDFSHFAKQKFSLFKFHYKSIDIDTHLMLIELIKILFALLTL